MRLVGAEGIAEKLTYSTRSFDFFPPPHADWAVTGWGSLSDDPRTPPAPISSTNSGKSSTHNRTHTKKSKKKKKRMKALRVTVPPTPLIRKVCFWLFICRVCVRCLFFEGKLEKKSFFGGLHTTYIYLSIRSHQCLPMVVVRIILWEHLCFLRDACAPCGEVLGSQSPNARVAAAAVARWVLGRETYRGVQPSCVGVGGRVREEERECVYEHHQTGVDDSQRAWWSRSWPQPRETHMRNVARPHFPVVFPSNRRKQFNSENSHTHPSNAISIAMRLVWLTVRIAVLDKFWGEYRHAESVCFVCALVRL